MNLRGFWVKFGRFFCFLVFFDFLGFKDVWMTISHSGRPSGWGFGWFLTLSGQILFQKFKNLIFEFWAKSAILGRFRLFLYLDCQVWPRCSNF